MTKILDIVAGPGCGKSLISARIYARMKERNLNVEYIQEYPKKLVWLERYQELNNQWNVSYKQYRILKAMMGKINYIIFDSSLISGLYYNRYNPDNTSDVIKTEKAILEWYREFPTMTIYLRRHEDHKYEKEGRYQTEEEAKKLDRQLEEILYEQNISYEEYISDVNIIDEIIDKFISK